MRLAEPAARPDLLDGYLDRATDHDLPLMGHRARRPGIVRRWLTAYAAATSTTATYETIRDAATGGESAKPAKSTTTVYRDLLEAMWLVDPLLAWWPLGNPLSRLKRGPKHHLSDPALAARLIGATASGLVSGSPAAPRGLGAGPLLGALFESLVTLDVRVYAQAAGASAGHLRTWNDDREIDLIVEKDRRLLAIEVKLATTPEPRRHRPSALARRPPGVRPRRRDDRHHRPTRLPRPRRDRGRARRAARSLTPTGQAEGPRIVNAAVPRHCWGVVEVVPAAAHRHKSRRRW